MYCYGLSPVSLILPVIKSLHYQDLPFVARHGSLGTLYRCECTRGHLESKERFAIQRYLLIIGKKQNMQVLSHTFAYFPTSSPWTLRQLSYRDTSLLIPSSYQTAAWLFIGSPRSLSVMNVCSPVRKHCAPFSDTVRVHNMFTIHRNKSLVNFTGSDVLRLQKPNYASHLTVGGS